MSHPMRPLWQDVDVATMRSMREEQGMSNTEIANALGTSRETVWKYLGPGPRKRRKKPARAVAVETPTPPKARDDLFRVVETLTTLEGRTFTYVLNLAKSEVFVRCDDTMLDIDALDALLDELHYLRNTLQATKGVADL